MHDVFFFTDIHGMRLLYDAIMQYCYEQDPEASIIFGGDAIDRGIDGYGIMKELLKNPKVVYLMGNHEDMFVRAAKEIKAHFDFTNREPEDIIKTLQACRYYDYKYQGIQDSLYNGGLSTLMDWINEGCHMEIVEQIERLPRTFSYEDIDFCHAAGVYETFKAGANAEYEGKEMEEMVASSLIWTRTGLHIGWAPNRIAVFGHTPTPYLDKFVGEYLDPALKILLRKSDVIQPVKYYANTFDGRYTGAKLDMDVGAFATNRAFVLNVLTMQAYGFKLENEKVKKIGCISFAN